MFNFGTVWLIVDLYMINPAVNTRESDLDGLLLQRMAYLSNWFNNDWIDLINQDSFAKY